MAMEGGNAAKKVLVNIRGYLQDNLPVDGDLISRLQGRNLLDKNDADRLRAAVAKGGTDGVDRLLDFMHSYYTEEMLETFCVFLEENSKPAKLVLLTVATRIREEMKRYQPHPNQPAESQQDVSGPSGTGPLPMEFSTPHPSETTQDDVPGPSDTDSHPLESSAPHPSKISQNDVLGPSEISAQNNTTRDIFYPVIGDLEDDFSDLATEVLEQIKSLDKGKLAKLCTFLNNRLKPRISPFSPPPYVPEEYDKLKSFLISSWDPLQIRVLQAVVKHLKSDELSQQLRAYEEVMEKKIPAFLAKCKTKKVPYKRLPHHTSVAVTIDYTPEEISLSRILELKEFFVSKLGLGEEHFEGFSTGSTVLYFSIPEDSVWCLPACLHPSNLPQLEEWKVVSLSVEGKFTIDLVEKRIIDVLVKQSLSKHLYMNEVLMNEVTQLREKMAEMEKPLRYYREKCSDEMQIYHSVQDPMEIVEDNPISEEENSESEPPTKKTKLKEFENQELKSYVEHESEQETGNKWELGSDIEELQDEGEVTKNVLHSLHSYLQNLLPADMQFIYKLQENGLLSNEMTHHLAKQMDMKGGNSGVDGLLHYMSSYYDEEKLEKFCVFLEEYSQPARPLLSEIAKRIREDLKRHQPHPIRLTVSQQDVPATQMEVTDSKTSSSATKSKPEDRYYPVISELEDDFSDLATEVLELIESLNGRKLVKLCNFLANFLRPKFPPSAPPPHVPEEYDKLKSFLVSRWDPLQIRVLQGVVRHLKSDELSQHLKAYEEVMGEKIPAFLVKCKAKKVPYKRLPRHSSAAVTIDYTPEEISLSRILELKEFFVSKLGLGEEHFEGFFIFEATQGEPTPSVFTMDERSQKIEEIVDMYRNGKVSLPEIPELEDDFDDIMGSLNAELSSADPKVISKLVGVLGVKYRRYIHDVKPVEPPSIPNTPDGLYKFITKKSTTYEILLIHHAVEVLNCEDLRRTLQNYESKLADHLRLTLESYKKRKVTLPLCKHHTHLAVVLSKEQVLLSLVLHIKNYLTKYLQLEEAVFEGFV